MPRSVISPTQTITTAKGDLAEVLRELRRAARLEEQGIALVVSFSVTFDWAKVYGHPVERPKTLDLYRDRGIRPSLIVKDVDRWRSLAVTLRSRMLARPGVEDLGYVIAVQMTLTPPKK